MTKLVIVHGKFAARMWIEASTTPGNSPLDILEGASQMAGRGRFMGRGRLVDTARNAFIELVYDDDEPGFVSDVSMGFWERSPTPVPEDVEVFSRWALQPTNKNTMIVQGIFLR
jgi:hypothetical protein